MDAGAMRFGMTDHTAAVRVVAEALVMGWGFTHICDGCSR